MSARAAGRALCLLLVLVVLGSVAPPPALSVTKSQVDEACASSRAQHEEYVAARTAYEEAHLALEATWNRIEAVEYQRARVQGIVDRRQAEIDQTGERIQELAVQLYIQGGGGSPGLVFFADSLDELLTGSEFLAAATQEDIGSLDDMVALRSDLERFQGELAELDAELRELEAEQQEVASRTQEAAAAEQAAWEKLSGRCRQLQARYEAEQAAIAARRRAAGNGRAAGVGAISGFRCPFPGSSFIDSWGFPRSGGRRHKGVDMMGPYGAPLIAAGSGYVSVGSSGLGGRTLWVISDSGYAYYYAHLSSWAVSSGQRVSAGEVVGYNGDTGNARGGAPHLHFEIHPGGRGASAVNPYPTVAAACR